MPRRASVVPNFGMYKGSKAVQSVSSTPAKVLGKAPGVPLARGKMVSRKVNWKKMRRIVCGF